MVDIKNKQQGIEITSAFYIESKRPYCIPEWIGGYTGWFKNRLPLSNAYIGLYQNDKKELIASTRYEF